jgi:hypothetical protein
LIYIFVFVELRVRMGDMTITVHRYRIADPATGEWVVQLSKASEAHISEVGGQIIANTAEQVATSALNPQGQFVPSWNSKGVESNISNDAR